MSQDLERVFSACFEESHQTVLEGGGDEPVYLPCEELVSEDRPADAPGARGGRKHRVVYRSDYFASALHEVAHWCLAGAARRRLEDYGYWYAPDGRDVDQQVAFERAEAKPQALESIFSDACGFEFNLSADNLAAGTGPSRRFADAVAEERRRFLERGLPSRADRFLQALRDHYSS